MRRDGLARQAVFRIDDPRRPAGRARKGLERIGPRRTGAEIDGAEIVRERAVDLDALVTALLHQTLGAAQLRMRRYALVHVALHARQDLREKGIGVIFRAHDALERVAAHAVEQLALLLIGAGNARQPFAIGQLRGEVCGLAQLEIQRRGFLLRDFDGVVMVQLVADRAHAQDILTWIQLARREAEAAVLAGHDRERDGRAFLGGAHQHALHGVFLGGTDEAGQCRALRLRKGGGARKQHGERRTGGDEKVTTAHGFLPEGVVLLASCRYRPCGLHVVTSRLRAERSADRTDYLDAFDRYAMRSARSLAFAMPA